MKPCMYDMFCFKCYDLNVFRWVSSKVLTLAGFYLMDWVQDMTKDCQLNLCPGS